MAIYTADSIRDSIRTQTADSQVPTLKLGALHLRRTCGECCRRTLNVPNPIASNTYIRLASTNKLHVTGHDKLKCWIIYVSVGEAAETGDTWAWRRRRQTHMSLCCAVYWLPVGLRQFYNSIPSSSEPVDAHCSDRQPHLPDHLPGVCGHARIRFPWSDEAMRLGWTSLPDSF